jgi:hypothetical protein
MGAKSKDIMQSCVIKRAIEFTTCFVMEQFIHNISEPFFRCFTHDIFLTMLLPGAATEKKVGGGG